MSTSFPLLPSKLCCSSLFPSLDSASSSSPAVQIHWSRCDQHKHWTTGCRCASTDRRAVCVCVCVCVGGRRRRGRLEPQHTPKPCVSQYTPPPHTHSLSLTCNTGGLSYVAKHKNNICFLSLLLFFVTEQCPSCFSVSLFFLTNNKQNKHN